MTDLSIEATPVIEKIWKPNKGKQDLFLSLPLGREHIFEAFYGGAAGGGKTEALMMYPIVRQWTENRNFRGLIVRRLYRELEESIIDRSRRGQINADGTEIPSFSDLGATYNSQHKRWTFPSGATITFGHAEEEADVRKYDTAQFHYCAFDELTSFTEFQYSFLAFSRVRSNDPSLPPFVASASNPGNVGHGWVRKRFVEPFPKGGRILQQTIAGQKLKRIFIQAFLTDNPVLMQNDPMYIARLEMLPEAEKAAKLYGDWWTFTGQVFDEWRIEPFSDEPADARHVIPEQEFPAYLPRILALDWGFKALTYGLFGVALPNKRAIAYKEIGVEHEGVRSWTTRFANACLEEGIDPLIVLDPSAWQHRDEVSIQEQFVKAWREITGKTPRLEKAVNDRLGGKMLIHDYLRWRRRAKYIADHVHVYDRERADWILRNRGLAEYKAYLSLFDEQPTEVEEILPKFQVTQNCPLLIKTIPLCVYNDTGKNLEDVKEFDGDDPYDTLRYFLQGVDKMFHSAKSAEDYEQAKAQTAFDANELDINSFYRRMEILETKKKKKRAPIVMVGRSRRRYR